MARSRLHGATRLPAGAPTRTDDLGVSPSGVRVVEETIAALDTIRGRVERSLAACTADEPTRGQLLEVERACREATIVAQELLAACRTYRITEA